MGSRTVTGCEDTVTREWWEVSQAPVLPPRLMSATVPLAMPTHTCNMCLIKHPVQNMCSLQKIVSKVEERSEI